MMIQAMTEQNMKVQNLFNEGIYSLNFDGTKVGIESFMLPPVGTTPEEAQAAISPGGAYSVEAVSDRIFGLAEALAGGDAGTAESEGLFRKLGVSDGGIIPYKAVAERGIYVGNSRFRVNVA